MLAFVGELLRVRRTRLSPSFGGFGALRPAVLRLKALSRGRRLWRPGAACNSSVTGLGGRGSPGCSVNELAGLFDARGPSLRQQLGRSLQNGGTRPAPEARAAQSRSVVETPSCFRTRAWTAGLVSGRVSRVPAGQWPAGRSVLGPPPRLLGRHVASSSENETREQY